MPNLVFLPAIVFDPSIALPLTGVMKRRCVTGFYKVPCLSQKDAAWSTDLVNEAERRFASGSHVKAAGLPTWSSLEARRKAVGQAKRDEVGRLDQDCDDLFTQLRQVRRPHGHVLLGEIDGPGS